MGRKAVFFDRDGTVNYRIAGRYVKSIDEFCFIPDFMDFFKSLSGMRVLKILVTNQQGIGKKIMTEDNLNVVHSSMQNKLLMETGANFDDIYFCPDLEGSGSYLRKPNPGMLLQAVEKWGLEKESCWMFGDSISDVKAGKAVGMHTVLLGASSPGHSAEADYAFKNFYIARSFFKANGLFFDDLANG